MESDPGPEECPVAQQKSDVSGAAMAAGEAQMTWLTYREKGALRSCLRGLDRAQSDSWRLTLGHLGSGVCSGASTGLL